MPEAIKSHDIISFVHCRMCNEEWEMSDKSMSPREYAHIEVGINIDNQILIGNTKALLSDHPIALIASTV